MAGARVSWVVKRADRGWAKLVKAADVMERERGMHAKAGILGAAAKAEHPSEDARGKKPTNVQLAAIHEFGVPGKIPARPFIQGTFVLHRQEYRARLRKIAGNWFTKTGDAGRSLRHALGFMGMRMAADMKLRVTQGEGIPPPNAPSTIARKLNRGAWKSVHVDTMAQLRRVERDRAANAKRNASGMPRPLVDTGRMVGSISHEVATGAEGGRP